MDCHACCSGPRRPGGAGRKHPAGPRRPNRGPERQRRRWLDGAYGELYQFPNAGLGSTEAYGELYQFPNAGLDPVVGTVPVAAPGFDYGDAVIGAAIAFCAALLAAAGVLVLRRSRRSATLA